VYAFMQNIGVVNDHIHGCFRATDWQHNHFGFELLSNTVELAHERRRRSWTS